MVVHSFFIRILRKDRNVLERKHRSSIAIMLTFLYGMPRHVVMAPCKASLSSISAQAILT